MNEELPSAVPERAVSNPPAEPQPVPQPTPPKQSRRRLWIIAGAAAAAVCLCAIGCLALGGSAYFKVMQETGPIQSVLDSFMSRMEAKDPTGAFALFSPRVQQQMKMSDLEKMLQGNNYVLFDGYRSLTVDNLNLTATANSDSRLPQGLVGQVQGTVRYDGGFEGTITGTLEKVNGVWMIYRVDIVVPPNKFAP